MHVLDVRTCILSCGIPKVRSVRKQPTADRTFENPYNKSIRVSNIPNISQLLAAPSQTNISTMLTVRLGLIHRLNLSFSTPATNPGTVSEIFRDSGQITSILAVILEREIRSTLHESIDLRVHELIFLTRL